MMTAPIYGGEAVPLQVRGMLAAALRCSSLPRSGRRPVAHSTALPGYLMLVGAEAAIGSASAWAS